jgi:propanol-preferring alcohol dehydrogenase
VGGDVTIVGIGGGTLPVGIAAPALAASVAGTYWGTRDDLVKVVDLARSGAVRVHVETYTIDEAPHAYRRLRDGLVNGRAVVLPNV